MVPSATTVMILNTNKAIIIGMSQYFFLTFKNSILKTVFSLAKTMRPSLYIIRNHEKYEGIDKQKVGDFDIKILNIIQPVAVISKGIHKSNVPKNFIDLNSELMLSLKKVYMEINNDLQIFLTNAK